MERDIQSFARFCKTDVPYEESYVIFWLDSEATYEQIKLVESYLEDK